MCCIYPARRSPHMLTREPREGCLTGEFTFPPQIYVLLSPRYATTFRMRQISRRRDFVVKLDQTSTAEFFFTKPLFAP